MSNSKEFIDGVFITEFDGQYGDFLSIGLTDEGLRLLQALPKNERGVRNFVAFRQRDDKRRYSPRWPKNVPKPERQNKARSGGQQKPVNNSKDYCPF